eukprot:CFRG7025T1
MPTLGRNVVRFKSSDGHLYDVSEDIIDMCPTAKHLLLQKRTWFRNALGGSVFSIEGSHVILKKEGRILASLLQDTPEEAIVSLPEVSGEALDRVLAFCMASIPSGSQDDDHDHHLDCNAAIPRDWENEAMALEQGLLCELASAAYYLDIKPLVNLTSRIIASKISGKSTAELRETFADLSVDGEGLDFDVSCLSTRLRLQRKLAVQKRIDDKESQNHMPPPAIEDKRTVDELMDFIDGVNRTDAEKSTSASAARRMKRKKKKQQQQKQKEKQTQSAVTHTATDHSDGMNVNASIHGLSETSQSNQNSKYNSEKNCSPPSYTPSDRKTSSIAIESSDEKVHYQAHTHVQTHKQECMRSPASGNPEDRCSSKSPLQLPPDITIRLSDRVRIQQSTKNKSILPSADEVEWADSDEENFDVSPELRAAVDKEVEEFRRRLDSVGYLFGAVS